jgi:hypothetical protein
MVEAAEKRWTLLRKGVPLCCASQNESVPAKTYEQTEIF